MFVSKRSKEIVRMAREVDENRPSSSKDQTSVASSPPPSVDPELQNVFDNLSDDSYADPNYSQPDLNESSSDSDIQKSFEEKTYHTLTAVAVPDSVDENDSIAPNPEPGETGRPKKGRKRKYGGLDRATRKQLKYQNKEHVNWKKKKIPAKQFCDYNCNCPLQCQQNLSKDQRENEFKKFYELSSYNAQNMFIAANITEKPKKRTYVKTTTNNSESHRIKIFSRTYHLHKIAVCREMFVKTLSISTKRVNTALTKMRSEHTVVDKRGTQAGWNKLSDERKNNVIDHINKFPRYVSHYRRTETEAKFLSPELNLTKMYELYVSEIGKTDAVSKSSYKTIFYTNFNLKFKSLKKDTCNKCDSYNIKIMNSETDEEKSQLKNEHEEHVRIAASAQKKMKADMSLAFTSDQIECLTYDLEKTLPLPRIPTNIIFYKRQIWLYNCGIHSGKAKKGFCYPWVEGTAGRGAQEVGSCLLKHLKNNVNKDAEEVILWSDSCGGQNRNIKIVLMLKTAFEILPNLKTVSFRYLISGHSFLPNDDDFGKVETALRGHQRLYVPEDYHSIMKTCRKKNPLLVTTMSKEDFFGSSQLESNITNRKKGTKKEKINWLNTREILLKREKPFSIFMRQHFDGEISELNLQKGRFGRPRATLSTKDLIVLWPDGKGISEPKLDDIKSILHLIPKDCLPFYRTLFADKDAVDDIDGFGANIDFPPEDD